MRFLTYYKQKNQKYINWLEIYKPEIYILLSSGNKHMINLNNTDVGNDWKWIFWALFPRQRTLSHASIDTFLLQGHKLCKKTRYFNAW
jgi:hypothetical protein